MTGLFNLEGLTPMQLGRVQKSLAKQFRFSSGIMTTVAALCLAHGIDMHVCGETELARISQPEIVEKIRAKQAAKPTGSALPIAQPKEQPNG